MLSVHATDSMAMTDLDPDTSNAPPDRLSNNPRSKFHDPSLLERGIGIRLNGQERHNVDEYCISEGWVRVPAGKALDRRGQPMTLKLQGEVQAWFLDDTAPAETPAD